MYKHAVSHNISMKCDFFYKSWLKMFQYGSNDYKTKTLKQIERIKDV